MNKGFKQTIQWGLIMLQVLTFSIVCEAGGPISPFVRSIDGVKIINFHEVSSCRQVYYESRFSFFPKKMNQVDSSERVFQEIINFNIKNLFTRDHMKGLKKHADTISEGLASNYTSENGHKLAFKVDAIRDKTELSYDGQIAAKLVFKMSNKELNIEISKQLARRTQIVYTHKDHTTERSDLLAMRFTF
ncbi:MAG: hypothetical protein KDD40_00010 [Bdellovibrionales bacterium]|nr:hypothetical protein [Bdellovibrionales bacterium]